MTNTEDKLDALSDEVTIKPFGDYQEEAIISLALDHPEFFTSASRFIKPDHFARLECKLVMAEILNSVEKYDIIPTRGILRNQLAQQLTEDDKYEEVFKLVNRKSDPREVPYVKETLLKWSKERAYGLLYSDEAVEAYNRGDFEYLETLMKDANRIADVGAGGLWLLENVDMLFHPDAVQHRTTGFANLDKLLNNGGPSSKEVVCWLAATNVGKSIMLCNNAITSFRGEGPDGPGQDVLLITFELSSVKTALRCLASSAGVPINELSDHQTMVKRIVDQMRVTYKKRILIYDMPPDECSVAHIYALLDNLKRIHGWKPNVIILDYMDLMVSRNPAYNKDDYTRQKHVSNEIRGLAKNEDVLVFTATQTNRSGADTEQIADLTKAAESFGKQFALDYVISLNQSRSDRAQEPPIIRLFVAKNRNGPKHETLTCQINYNTMVVRELL